MKLHLHPRPYLTYLALFLLQFFVFKVNAQTHTQRHVSMIANSWGYWEYLPQNYGSESGTYPLIVFLHGIGELGDGGVDQLSKVLANGTPKTIANGTFPASFTVNGETFKFIVISPQFLNWPSTPDVQGVIDYCVKNYRVNANRIYLTGLSMGGGAVWDYAGATMENANRLAAIVPVCGVSGPVDERINVLTKAALPIWGTHNLLDPDVTSSNTIGYIDKIAALNLLLNPLSILNLNPIAKKTIFPVAGHDAWSTTYNPSFKENDKNIYEWMLQYSRGASSAPAPPPAQNQVPIANAGSDQWITLPTSSVVLNGSGKDNDGSIANYSWTKVSGPGSYNFSFGNVPNPTVSNLTEGTYSFRLTVTDNVGATAYDDVTIIVSPGAIAAPPAPPVTTTAAIPGRVEAENYSSMFGVIAEKTTDDGGGQDVGWIEYGDWMNFNVNVTAAGTYNVNFRVASTASNLQLQLKTSDGTVLTTTNLPNTGAYQAWQTVSATVTLKAGTQTLTVASIQNGFWNLNWFEFVAPVSAPSAPLVTTYATVPGKIEAENYSNMFGVIAEPTLDANGGQDVGWIEQGDWIDYNVNVTSAGTYTVNFRVATPYASQQLQLKASDGSVLTTVSIPQTGAFQTWKTVSATVTLKAGNQTLRVYSSQIGWWNINYLEFVATSVAAAPLPGYSAIPGKIESETYSNSYGVIIEPTIDAGGGSDVGWIELGDWMDYNVSVAAAGNYTVNFRVATPNLNQQLAVKNSSGTILATVNIPQTGGFQVWKTVSVALYLFAGNQTIRIYSQNGFWNMNWMEFIAGSLSADGGAATQGSGVSSGITATSDNIPLAEQLFNIYPNPVNKVFTMEIKNNYTGAMNVQIVNLAGAIVKQYNLTKGTSVSQLSLPVGELTKGTYMLKVQIGKWSETRKLIKL